ncbi:MAG: alpha/beta hydrolase fold domain-containing protein [Candidatus Lokiarchaeota archaeon]|nr:alpha/beta hydrolase fold domain-containing protein [Candidatus Lokiarchaeota archaeon]
MDWKKFFKYFILILGYSILALGFSFGIIILTGGLSPIGVLINIYLPIVAIFSFIIFPIIIIILLTLNKKKKKYWILTLIFGCLVITLYILPLGSIPYSVNQGESQFSEAFGSDYMDYIPLDLKNKFLDVPYGFWNVFHINQNSQCNISKSCGPYLKIPIYNDSFYFDYYCPRSGSGPFPTIINIHGGAFVAGGPGITNVPEVSQYLANQGYVVIDCSYGLGKFKKNIFINLLLGSVQFALGEGRLNKSYTILESTEQILANLTDFIVKNASELKIDTNNIFVLGRSAGAALAGMFYGYNSTQYPIYKNWFNSTLKLKGLILYYPPTNYTPLFYPENTNPALSDVFFGNESLTPDLLNSLSPINLVDQCAPPTLIFHGMNDGLVPHYESVRLKNRLDEVNATSILISFPFYGHMFDLDINNPAGQISLYYLERFLASIRYTSTS